MDELKQAIGRLLAAGHTQQQIAAHLRISQSSISRIYRGKTTDYATGESIIRLAKRLCKGRKS